MSAKIKNIIQASQQAQDHVKLVKTDWDIKILSIFLNIRYYMLTIYEKYFFSVNFHPFSMIIGAFKG